MDDTKEPNFDFRTLMIKIDSELTKADVEYLVFLCESHLNKTTQQSIVTGHQLLDILERKGLISVKDMKLLNFLFRIIGRIDLLEMLPDKSDVENDSGSGVLTSVDDYVCPFRHVLFRINEELSQEEVLRLRYAYGKVPKNVTLSSAVDLFKIMKKQKTISSDNVGCLKHLLEIIERNDLVDLIENFSRQSGAPSIPNPSGDAGDSTSARPCPKCAAYPVLNQNSSAPIQSCHPMNSPSNGRPVIPVSPMRPANAPPHLVQVSHDDHYTGAEQTFPKSLYEPRNARESEFAQSSHVEQSRPMETASEFNAKPFSSSRSMSVPSGTPYYQSMTPGLPRMHSHGSENYTASNGEAAQVSEEPVQMGIPDNGKREMTDERRDEDVQMEIADDDDKYKMSAKPRGICLVINNDDFEIHSDREFLRPRRGSAKDTENLKDFFELLKFDVWIMKNLTLSQTRECLVRLSSLNHASNDSFVCCFLSHSCEGAVYCSDSLKMEVKELTSYFSPKLCPSLGGKPKLFFLSCCQVKAKPDAVSHPEAVQLERDGPSSGTDQVSSEAADFLIDHWLCHNVWLCSISRHC